jgi:hypothetical protein
MRHTAEPTAIRSGICRPDFRWKIVEPGAQNARKNRQVGFGMPFRLSIQIIHHSYRFVQRDHAEGGSGAGGKFGAAQQGARARQRCMDRPASTKRHRQRRSSLDITMTDMPPRSVPNGASMSAEALKSSRSGRLIGRYK